MRQRSMDGSSRRPATASPRSTSSPVPARTSRASRTVSSSPISTEAGERPCRFPQVRLSGVGRSWSPDESALVVAACLPCNDAIEPGQPATAENHEHLFIVPVDGSPVRELLDDTDWLVVDPDWSPDGSTFATVRNECASGEAPPQCSGEVTSSLVAGGRRRRHRTRARHQRSARGRLREIPAATVVPRR